METSYIIGIDRKFIGMHASLSMITAHAILFILTEVLFSYEILHFTIPFSSSNYSFWYTDFFFSGSTYI